MGWKIVFFIFLLLAFYFLFDWMGQERILRKYLKRTYRSLDAQARRRLRENRRALLLMQKQKGFWYRVEQRLIYSGLQQRLPGLTPEVFIVLILLLSAAVYVPAAWVAGTVLGGLAGIGLVLGIGYLCLSTLMAKNYRSVNDNLLKFLDFLGNYSITAGEVTGILNQISKYMDEPLKSVLDECYYEAQTSGDASLALLSMAEKIEHPKFKELVRNIEISIRYSADFTSLVLNSRRSVREHLRTRQERKALVNEAVINMILLAGMSVIILISVEQLIGTSIWLLLCFTLPGRIALAAILIIFGLLYRQVRNMDR